MTCVVGWVRENKIYMGADNVGASSWLLMSRTDQKVFIKGKMIYGFTSSYRMGNILRYSFSPPSFPEGMDVDEYMCSLYIDAVRKAFKGAGFSAVKDGVESGGTFLVGFKGKLYEVEDDFQVGIPGQDFWACGCGREYALGALKSIQNSKIDGTTEARIEFVLSIAEYYSPFVRRPFKIMVLAN